METKYSSAFKRLRSVAKWAITHDKEQLIESPFKRLQLLSPLEKWGTRAMNASKTCFVFSRGNRFFNNFFKLQSTMLKTRLI